MAARMPMFQTISIVSTNIMLQWTALQGLAYQLQFTAALGADSWSSLGPPRAATNAAMTFSDALPADSQRFYRLILLP